MQHTRHINYEKKKVRTEGTLSYQKLRTWSNIYMRMNYCTVMFFFSFFLVNITENGINERAKTLQFK